MNVHNIHQLKHEYFQNSHDVYVFLAFGYSEKYSEKVSEISLKIFSRF